MLLSEIIDLPEMYPVDKFEATIVKIRPSHTHKEGQLATLVDGDTKINAFFFNRQNLDGLDGERLLFKGFRVDKQLRQWPYNNSYKVMPDISIHMWGSTPQLRIKRETFIKRLTKANVLVGTRRDLTQKDYDDLKNIRNLNDYLGVDLTLDEEGKIYRILNEVTGEMYIGKTRQSLNKIFEDQINDLRDSYTGGTPLRQAMIYYGEEKFKIELLYRCKYKEELAFVGSFLINKLNTMIPHGYNITNSQKQNKVLMDKMVSSYKEL